MINLPRPIADLFHRVGISQKSSWRIRFGGVVGKEAWVGSIGIICLCVIAYHSRDAFVERGCFIGVIGLVIFTTFAMAFHGHAHPDQATLEGADMVAYLFTQKEYGMKGSTAVPEDGAVVSGGLGRRDPVDVDANGE